MSLPTLGSNEIVKLRQLIDESVKIQLEINALSEGKRDTIKAVAADLNIPVRVINKAIRMEIKDNREEEKEDFGDADDLFEIYKTPSIKSWS